MAKASKQGPHKQGTDASANTPKTAGVNKQPAQTQAQVQASQTQSSSLKSKQSSRSNRTSIGGTAVPGAKSTQPKEISSTNNPQQQQAESYNRTMRRRMEQMGTGPGQQSSPATKQQKRMEKRRRRIEEHRHPDQIIHDGTPDFNSARPTRGYFLHFLAALLDTSSALLHALLLLSRG